MSEFVYLYRGGERPDSPQQGEQEMQKWVTWLNELGKKGHIKDHGQPAIDVLRRERRARAACRRR